MVSFFNFNILLEKLSFLCLDCAAYNWIFVDQACLSPPELISDQISTVSAAREYRVNICSADHELWDMVLRKGFIQLSMLSSGGIFCRF